MINLTDSIANLIILQLEDLSMRRMIGYVAVLAALVVLFIGCASNETRQYGLEGEDTIALNLTKDPNVGTIFVTHVNGEATGAVNHVILMGLSGETVYVNPLYVKLNGRPIVFTLQVPVVTRYDSQDKPIVRYKTTELRLTQLADIKAGDVLTLRWMYQTQTFVFMDSTGNIVQQIIPTFNWNYSTFRAF